MVQHDLRENVLSIVIDWSDEIDCELIGPLSRVNAAGI